MCCVRFAASISGIARLRQRSLRRSVAVCYSSPVFHFSKVCHFIIIIISFSVNQIILCSMLVQKKNTLSCQKNYTLVLVAQPSSTARIRIRIIAHEKHLWLFSLWIRHRPANETRTTATNERTNVKSSNFTFAKFRGWSNITSRYLRAFRRSHFSARSYTIFVYAQTFMFLTLFHVVWYACHKPNAKFTIFSFVRGRAVLFDRLVRNTGSFSRWRFFMAKLLSQFFFFNGLWCCEWRICFCFCVNVKYK